MAAVQSIFLSYRRSDAADVTGRIFDDLAKCFGERRIFKDVNSIPIASEYWQLICSQIQHSVVTVIIGPRWLEVLQDGKRRLDAPDDYVRLEIETALGSGVPVVPALVTNAAMPQADMLPSSIRALAALQAVHLRPDPDYKPDMSRFVGFVERYLPREISQPLPAAGFLDDLQVSCQNWHNEIVTTLATMLAVMRDPKLQHPQREAEIQRLNFIYQNTRSFLPKVLSARRTLASLGQTDKLARALDQFLELVAIPQPVAMPADTFSASANSFTTTCASLDLLLPRGSKPGFFERWWRGPSAQVAPFNSFGTPSATAANSRALQEVIDEIAALRLELDAQRSR